jgi:ABC-2 type transport system permease protein
MIAFGVGSDLVYPLPRTVVVTPPGARTEQLLQDYREQFGRYLRVTSYTTDLEGARRALDRNEIDAVLVLPPDPYGTLARGEQVRVRMLYNELDPTQSWVVPDYANTMQGDINRQILLRGTGQQQAALRAASGRLDTALQALDAANTAQSGGNRAEALRRVREARATSEELSALVGDLGAGVLGPAAGGARDRLADVGQRLHGAEQSLSTPGGPVDLSQSRQELQDLKDALDRFATVPPEVVVTPIKVETQLVSRIPPDVIVFFAPAMLALLIQHTAVSLGSLSLVRERLADTFDLYAVAPISNFQILLGKYLANLLFTLAITGALVAALVGFFNVPLFGEPWRLGLTLVTLALTSVGLGFALSLLASSERQAVQFAMLLLLGIVFFSGFALPVESLRQPALTFSYAMPATYGSDLLQDVMLRGLPGNNLFYGILGGLSVALFLLCLWLLSWRTRAS